MSSSQLLLCCLPFCHLCGTLCFRLLSLLHGGMSRKSLPNSGQLISGLSIVVVVITAQNADLLIRFMFGIKLPPSVHSRKLRGCELVQILLGSLRREIASCERWRCVSASKYRISRSLGVVIPTGCDIKYLSQYAEPDIPAVFSGFAGRGVVEILF